MHSRDTGRLLLWYDSVSMSSSYTTYSPPTLHYLSSSRPHRHTPLDFRSRLQYASYRPSQRWSQQKSSTLYTGAVIARSSSSGPCEWLVGTITSLPSSSSTGRSLLALDPEDAGRDDCRESFETSSRVSGQPALRIKCVILVKRYSTWAGTEL